MNRTIGSVILVIIIISCSTPEYLDNEQAMKMIDRISEIETEIELEIDNEGEVIDRLSITTRKYSPNKFKLYEKRRWNIGEQESFSKNYFREIEGLFYQEISISRGDYQTYYETNVSKEGRVVKAIRVDLDQRNNRSDTIFMNFEYGFRNNKSKEQLVIKSYTSEGEGIGRILYNEDEQILSKVSKIEDDTIQTEKYIYQGSKLIRTLTQDYLRGGRRRVYYYGEDEQLLMEEHFDGFDETKKLLEVDYVYGVSGQKISSVRRDFAMDKEQYIKYVTR